MLIVVAAISALGLNHTPAAHAGVNVFIGSPTIPVTIPPVNGTANLFVDSDGGTCTRQGTAAAYVNAAACSNLNAAYQAASAGDTVIVKTATYADQSFAARGSAMVSPGVTFQIEDNTAFGQIKFGNNPNDEGALVQNTHWITLQGSRFGWTAVGFTFYRVHDITIDGAVVDKGFTKGHAVWWQGTTDNTTFKNVDFCCSLDLAMMESWNPDVGGSANSDIHMFDSNFHDVRSTGGPVHDECGLMVGVPGWWLVRTHWWSCASTGNFNIGCFGEGCNFQQRDFFWSQNIFEAPATLTGPDKEFGRLNWDGCNGGPGGFTAFTGWVVEYNIFEGNGMGKLDECGSAANGLILRGNIGTWGANNGCPTGATYIKNIWTDEQCTGDNTAVPTLFNSTNFPNYVSANFNPTGWAYGASAVMVGKGDPSSYPAADRDGVTRPIGATPDAGPSEKG